MATKKLSAALLALTTPEFGYEVEMPSVSLNGVQVTATGTELNYVDGVTSGIQTQIDGKAATSHNHNASAITAGSLDGDRLPAMSGTKRGGTPAYGGGGGAGDQILGDNGWQTKNDVYSAFDVLTCGDGGATTTWGMDGGSYNAVLTLDQDTTLDIQDAANGMSGCLILKQDGTGGWALTLPAGSVVMSGSWGHSSLANSVDVITWIFDGTNYYFTIGKNYIVPV